MERFGFLLDLQWLAANGQPSLVRRYFAPVGQVSEWGKEGAWKIPNCLRPAFEHAGNRLWLFLAGAG